MATKSLEEKVSIQRCSGGVLFARSLVNTIIKDPEVFAETAETARHAELLASRMRMPALDVCRVVMAAWLSALAERPEMAAPLVRDYHLEDILGSPDLPEGEDKLATGSHVLNLVLSYRAIKVQTPGIERDLNAVRTRLRELWAATPEQQGILAKFMAILRDEEFLFNLEAPEAKVLIVDPAEVVTAVLTIPLMSRGYQVLAVGNVGEAEQVLAQEMPDLILCELKMLIEDGLSLCRKVRAHPELQDIPLVMMTASKSQRVARECVKAGADDVIVRPVDFELVFLKIRKILDARRAGAAPVEIAAAHTLAEAGVSGSLRDMGLSDVIQILCAGGKSTRLTLNQDGNEGVIYIQAGEIVDAQLAEHHAETAFYKLMGWKTGKFQAQAWTDFPPRTIDAPMMSLLMEGARLNDEGTA
jgi:CheY-like chemotaxis protein